jgi:hypothetical protein
MDKFLSGFIKVEKSVQIFTLVGIMLFLGYLGSVSYRGDRAPSPRTSPTTQQ